MGQANLCLRNELTVLLELLDSAGDERVNDLLVPSRVHNGDAQRGAVEFRGGWGGAFD